MSGTTFYKQCFPNGSVDLAFSATAMHWLGTSSPCQLTAMATGEEAEKYKQQAAVDWEPFSCTEQTKSSLAGKF
jgi:hypothetical protein